MVKRKESEDRRGKKRKESEVKVRVKEGKEYGKEKEVRMQRRNEGDE